MYIASTRGNDVKPSAKSLLAPTVPDATLSKEWKIECQGEVQTAEFLSFRGWDHEIRSQYAGMG